MAEIAVVAGFGVWTAQAPTGTREAITAAAVALAASTYAPELLGRRRDRAARREAAAAAAAAAERALVPGVVTELPESAAWLLHPSREVVRFFGRGWVLRGLQNWCTDPGGSLVRLVVGQGGIGKTRLARQFANQLTLAGWVWRSVAADEEGVVADWLGLGSRPARVLLVVDYADGRDAKALAQLLCAAHQVGGVRVLLLARTAGEWWTSLSAAYRAQGALLDAWTRSPGNVIDLPAQVDDAHAGQQIVADAMTDFAAYLHRSAPAGYQLRFVDAGTPVLRLHAEALVAVLGGVSDDRHDVLDEVLSHEQRYWRHAAHRAGLITDDVQIIEDWDPVLRQTAAVAALLGTGGGVPVTALLERIPALGGMGDRAKARVAAWLSGLYPPEASGGLGSIAPDLLAEALTVQVLSEMTTEQRRKVLAGVTIEQAVRALTILCRAAVHQPLADRLIDAAIDADPMRMCEATLQVGLQFPGQLTQRVAEQLTRAEYLDPTWTQITARRVPWPTREYSPIAVVLTGRIHAASETTVAPEAAAAAATNYAIRLAEAGRRAEALAVSGRAVRLWRQLAGLNRDVYLPDLAKSMNNHAIRLAEAGSRKSALGAAIESADLFRELAKWNREAYLPYLAGAVTNRALRLTEAGQPADALVASTEAVELHRELTMLNRDEFLPAMAQALSNHSMALAAAGWRLKALLASAEALELYRELTAINRDAYLPDLARSLSSHANRLAETGAVADTLPASAEAVELYQELAAINRDAFLPDLARSLGNHATNLAEARQRSTALAVSAEALGLFQELAAINRDANLPGLAMSLGNHANRLAEAGRPADALTLSVEAIKQYRELAEQHREAFLSDLARALSNHALELAKLGRRADALATATEAVKLSRELVATNRDAYLPDLATSLWNIGYVSLTLGHVTDEGVRITDESVRYYTELASAEPEAYRERRDAAIATLAALRDAISSDLRP